MQILTNISQQYQHKSNIATNVKKLSKSATKEFKRKVEAKTDNKIDITSFVANDLLTCARRRNNILTEATYVVEGRYKLSDVNDCFGSFAQACTKLKIINPANIEDKEMIVKDIKNVFEFIRQINEIIYQEYGAYSYVAINKRWGFNKLLVEAGLVTLPNLYPTYQMKRSIIHIRLIWTYTYNKKFYGA